MTAFGDALGQVLTERRLARRALAQRLGLSATAVSNWVAGVANPTHANVLAVEAELEIQPRGWLLGLAGYTADPPPEQPTVESAIRSDPGISADDKQMILRVLALARESYANRSQA